MDFKDAEDFCRALYEEDLSASYFLILSHLNRGSLTMGKLAKIAQFSTACATGIVDRMEKLNMVYRVRSTEDRREIEIFIGDTGRSAITRVEQTFDRIKTNHA